MQQYELLAELNILEDGTSDPFSNVHYVDLTGIQMYPYKVSRNRAMRLDLISFDFYGDVQYAYILMMINDILNVFSIKEGDILFYCAFADISRIIRTYNPPATGQQFVSEQLAENVNPAFTMAQNTKLLNNTTSTNKGARLNNGVISFGN